MILTCPSCGTQYVVKDGAIPPQGRRVRCASCKHSWHQDPESDAEVDAVDDEATIAEAALIEPRTGPEAEQRAYEAARAAEIPEDDASIDEAGNLAEDAAPDEQDTETAAGYPPIDPVVPPAEALAVAQVDAGPDAPLATAGADDRGARDEPWAAGGDVLDDEFSPFAAREPEAPRRNPVLTIMLIALLIAIAAAAFWFLAPAEWKQRIGIAGSGETPLQLMMTHSDRQKLASGNELLEISGRVINPTDESQDVPPIQAQLRSSTGRLVYSWTIAPPARTLPPGASATFNSAEVNVPAGGDELTITLGSTRT